VQSIISSALNCKVNQSLPNLDQELPDKRRTNATICSSTWHYSAVTFTSLGSEPFSRMPVNNFSATAAATFVNSAVGIQQKSTLYQNSYYVNITYIGVREFERLVGLYTYIHAQYVFARRNNKALWFAILLLTIIVFISFLTLSALNTLRQPRSVNSW